MSYGFIITRVVAAIWCVYLCVIVALLHIRYRKFIDKVHQTQPDFKEDLGGLWVTKKGGGWIGTKYVFRTPLPINYQTQNEELKELIRRHDVLLYYYWIGITFGTFIIICLLNTFEN